MASKKKPAHDTRKKTVVVKHVPVFTDCSKLPDNIFQSARPASRPFFVDAIINVDTVMDTQDITQDLKAYLWIPIVDKPSARPTVAWLSRAVETMIGWRNLGYSILVHCRAGFSRSSMITIAYYMKTQNLTRDDAVAYLRTHRPSATPNDGFMQTLKEYEDYLTAVHALDS